MNTNPFDFSMSSDLLVTLHSALQQQNVHITTIKGPCNQKKLTHDILLADLESIRGGKLYYPYLAQGRGRGALTELLDGSIKYDFITGVGVHILGHAHSDLFLASLHSAFKDTVMQGHLMQGPETVEFSRLLLNAATKKSKRLKHAIVTTSGAMAGENALKMAFQKRAPANRVLAFENCFMGRTCLMAQTTDNPNYRVGLPKMISVDYIPFYNVDDEDSLQKATETLKKYLATNGAESYAAMCFELVLGEGGFTTAPREFFAPLMELCRANQIPVLVDEVQTFARLTEPFAFSLLNLDEFVDIVWVGKASQACATLFTEDIKSKPGLISQTYTASTGAILGGIAVLKYMFKNDFYGEAGQIKKQETHFHNRLNELANEFPDCLKGPFGTGGMVAFTPDDGSDVKTKALLHKLYDNGVIAFQCGHGPIRVRFLPPVGVVTLKDIDNVCDILRTTLKN